MSAGVFPFLGARRTMSFHLPRERGGFPIDIADQTLPKEFAP